MCKKQPRYCFCSSSSDQTGNATQKIEIKTTPAFLCNETQCVATKQHSLRCYIESIALNATCAMFCTCQQIQAATCSPPAPKRGLRRRALGRRGTSSRSKNLRGQIKIKNLLPARPGAVPCRHPTCRASLVQQPGRPAGRSSQPKPPPKAQPCPSFLGGLAPG